MQEMPRGVLAHCWDTDHDKKVFKCVNLVKITPQGPQLPGSATTLYRAGSTNLLYY